MKKARIALIKEQTKEYTGMDAVRILPANFQMLTGLRHDLARMVLPDDEIPFNMATGAPAILSIGPVCSLLSAEAGPV